MREKIGGPYLRLYKMLQKNQVFFTYFLQGDWGRFYKSPPK